MCALTFKHGSVFFGSFSQRIMVPCKQLENPLKRFNQILGLRGSSISPYFPCLCIITTFYHNVRVQVLSELPLDSGCLIM